MSTSAPPYVATRPPTVETRMAHAPRQSVAPANDDAAGRDMADVLDSPTHHDMARSSRDQVPPLIEEVHEQHRPIISDGSWTHGLLECWAPRMRMMKAAVHIPCWNSFDPWCWRWRGACFGRTCSECFWVGIHPSRWARTVYGGALKNKYSHQAFSRTWKAVIGGLSSCYCCATFLLGLGAHAAATCCGAYGLNLMAWYSCASRLALRNRYNLPSAFGLPPGCDDCMVHLCCMYCASHQELRESAVRGIAGPGMHVLDVTDYSFRHVPCIEQRLAQRQAEMDASLESISRVPSTVQMAVHHVTLREFMQRIP